MAIAKVEMKSLNTVMPYYQSLWTSLVSPLQNCVMKDLDIISFFF